MPTVGEWPKRYHPASYSDDGRSYVVNRDVVVEGYQLRPDTWDSLTEWSSGVRVLDSGGLQAVALNQSLADDDLVRLGDFAMRAPDRWSVSRADGHYQRWAAADPEPATAPRQET